MTSKREELEEISRMILEYFLEYRLQYGEIEQLSIITALELLRDVIPVDKEKLN